MRLAVSGRTARHTSGHNRRVAGAVASPIRHWSGEWRCSRPSAALWTTRTKTYGSQTIVHVSCAKRSYMRACVSVCVCDSTYIKGAVASALNPHSVDTLRFDVSVCICQSAFSQLSDRDSGTTPRTNGRQHSGSSQWPTEWRDEPDQRSDPTDRRALTNGPIPLTDEP